MKNDYLINSALQYFFNMHWVIWVKLKKGNILKCEKRGKKYTWVFRQQQNSRQWLHKTKEVNLLPKEGFWQVTQEPSSSGRSAETPEVQGS